MACGFPGNSLCPQEVAGGTWRTDDRSVVTGKSRNSSLRDQEFDTRSMDPLPLLMLS